MAEKDPDVILDVPIDTFQRRFDRSTPQDTLREEFIRQIARKLSRLVLEENFTGDAAAQRIVSDARAEMETVCTELIKSEKETRLKHHKFDKTPLLDHLEKTVGAEKKVEEMRVGVSEDFYKKFATVFRSEKDTLEFLEETMQHPRMREHIMPLLRKVDTFNKDGWYFTENGGQQLYDIVKPLVHDERYVFPHEETELLYFLTYLPDAVRHPVQNLLMHHSYLDFAKREDSSAEKTGAGAAMRQGLITLLQEGIFYNGHWQRISNYGGSSEKMNEELAQATVKFEQAKKRMMDIATAYPESKAVLKSFLEYAEQTYENIALIHKKRGSSSLQQSDIGHFFKTSIFRDVHGVLDPESNAYRYRQKNGSKAVILEDDQRQMSDWKNLVQEHSPYSLPEDDSGAFTVPSGKILEMADDPETRLFLLDIQNGKDDMAGIRVAEALLRRMVEKCVQCNVKSMSSGEKYRLQRTVILWTMSPELLRVAQEHFAPLLQQKDFKQYVDEHNTFIRFRMQLKSGYIGFIA